MIFLKAKLIMTIRVLNKNNNPFLHVYADTQSNQFRNRGKKIIKCTLKKTYWNTVPELIGSSAFNRIFGYFPKES